MKRAATDHPKVRRLQRALGGIPRWQAWGLMEGLWQFCGQFTQQGDIGRMADEDLAEFLDWRDDPTQLVAAYISAGLVDRHPVHRLVVHDWHDHADNSIKGNLSKAGKDFVSRFLPGTCPGSIPGNSSQKPREYPRDMPRDHMPEPEPVPDPKPEPVPEPEPPARPRAKRQQVLDFDESDWNELVSIWPKKYDRGDGHFARAAFRRLIGDGTDPERIKEAARRYAALTRAQGTPQRFLKKLNNWLADGWEASLDLDVAWAKSHPADQPTMAEQLAALNELDRQPSEVSLIIEEYRRALPDGNDFKLP